MRLRADECESYKGGNPSVIYGWPPLGVPMRTMTSGGLQPVGGQAHLRQSRCVCFHPDCSCVCVRHLKLIYYPLIDKAYSSLLRMPRLSVPLLVGEVTSAYYLSEAVEGSPTAQGNEFSIIS